MDRLERILAFDTAGSSCSAAIWIDGAVVAQRSETMVRGHSERILPMIQAVVTEAEVSFEAMQGIAVTVGPGAFTGIRIGLATARGLALAGRLPVLGLTCLQAVAGAVPMADCHDRTLIVTLESKRADLFVQCFKDPASACSEPYSLLPSALDEVVPSGPLILAGDAVQRAAQALAAAGRDIAIAASSRLVDSAVVARLASERDAATWLSDRPQPLYLRAPDVTEPTAILGRNR